MLTLKNSDSLWGRRRVLPQRSFTVHQLGLHPAPSPLPHHSLRAMAPASVEISICICLHVGKHHRVANHGHKNSARPKHFLSTLFGIFPAGQRTTDIGQWPGGQANKNRKRGYHKYARQGRAWPSLALGAVSFGLGCVDTRSLSRRQLGRPLCCRNNGGRQALAERQPRRP